MDSLHPVKPYKVLVKNSLRGTKFFGLFGYADSMSDPDGSQNPLDPSGLAVWFLDIHMSHVAFEMQ